jgi:hypothetical protein
LKDVTRTVAFVVAVQDAFFADGCLSMAQDLPLLVVTPLSLDPVTLVV